MGLWRRRRSRAIELLSTATHADEMLEFYVGLLELQEGVAEKASLASESFASESFGVRQPRLRLEALPADAIEPLFREFLRGLEPIGTNVMASAARTLLDGDAAERARTLRTFWLERDAADFLPRAFTESLAWVLASSADHQTGGADSGGATSIRLTCPICASPPQVGLLRDESGALGRRLLVCTLCATEWGFPRLTCAHCGSTDADRLQVHQVDSVPHVRIEACEACTRYIKAVDFRKQGAAEPIVDDLATPELDLWARDRGLVKIRLNVLGL